jgi:hypothetical protein
VREGRGAGSVGIAKALEVGRASVYRTLANDSDPEPADMSEENYTIVVAQPNPHSPWEWEVYRNGAPLPARLRKGDFRSEGTARAAGKMALLEFLAALSRENSRTLSWIIFLFSFSMGNQSSRERPCANPLIVAT